MIYITIPVFNRKKYLEECLESLRKQTNQDFKVIVTDDGSTDGTSEMLAQDFPEVMVLHGDGNLWWTGAINKGVAKALELGKENDYILALNDDLIVPENYIENFYKLAAANPDTLIGSVVTYYDNPDKIASGGVRINWLTAKSQKLNDEKSLSSFGKGFTIEVSSLTGRGVLIPSKVFRELGLYNDKHYQQCGDTELPRRAYKAGYKLIVAYDVPVFSHVMDKGHINHSVSFTLKDVKKYFFDIRSNANIKYKFWFAYDASPNIFIGTSYFLLKLARITGHFVKRLKI